VAHLAAPAGLLVPAERQGRVEDVVAVDPDGPGAELLRQGVGLGNVLGPDPGPEAVTGVVRLGGDLVQAAERLANEPELGGTSLKPDSGHAGTISITIRVRRTSWNAMKPPLRDLVAAWPRP
jgi:hypothetical protein